MKHLVNLFGGACMVVAGALLPPVSAAAAVREVCSYGCAYPTIQAAIDAAADGDLVRVHDGVYRETVNFKNRAVTVRSVNGPKSTVIDGGEQDRGVVFESFEGPDSVLDGFTITNCRSLTSGGGIYILDAGPTIQNCVITGNKATFSGGGVYAATGTSALAPRICDTVVVGNAADTRGGGVILYSSSVTTVLERLTVSGNTPEGLYLSGQVSLSDSTVSGNTNGIRIQTCALIVERCEITGNTGSGLSGNGSLLLVDSRVTGNGNSGVYLSSLSTPRHRIVRSTISGNETPGQGGGIHLFQTDLAIEASVISGNRAGQEGGGIYNNSSDLLLDGVTVANNYAGINGGGLHAFDGTVVNSIFWGNYAGTEGSQIYAQGAGSPLAVTSSDVAGGWSGSGNINATPGFLDAGLLANPGPNTLGDFRLEPGSPCLDVGEDTGVALDRWGDPAPQGGGRDVGADERALLANGSFESASELLPPPWKGRGLRSRDGRVTDDARSGAASLLLTGGATRKLSQEVVLSGAAGDLITLGLWSRALKTSRAGGAYGASMKVFYADGTAKTSALAFSRGTHDWEYRDLAVTAGKDYVKVLVSLFFVRQKGLAWFDDVALHVEAP